MESVISTNNKISIQINSDGFSVLIYDINSKLLSSENIAFDLNSKKSNDISDLINAKISPILNPGIIEIEIETDFYTLIPKNIFNNTDTEKLFNFLYPELKKQNFTYKIFDNVISESIILCGINNELLKALDLLHFGFSSCHHVEKLLQPTNEKKTLLICNIRKNKIDVLVFSNNAIIHCNCFDYKSNEDILYHLLNTSSQLSDIVSDLNYTLYTTNKNIELEKLLSMHLENFSIKNEQ